MLCVWWQSTISLFFYGKSTRVLLTPRKLSGENFAILISAVNRWHNCALIVLLPRTWVAETVTMRKLFFSFVVVCMLSLTSPAIYFGTKYVNKFPHISYLLSVKYIMVEWAWFWILTLSEPNLFENYYRVWGRELWLKIKHKCHTWAKTDVKRRN